MRQSFVSKDLLVQTPLLEILLMTGADMRETNERTDALRQTLRQGGRLGRKTG